MGVASKAFAAIVIAIFVIAMFSAVYYAAVRPRRPQAVSTTRPAASMGLSIIMVLPQVGSSSSNVTLLVRYNGTSSVVLESAYVGLPNGTELCSRTLGISLRPNTTAVITVSCGLPLRPGVSYVAAVSDLQGQLAVREFVIAG